MSMESLRKSECTGKHPYPSRSKAAHALKPKLHIYRCPHCGWFHVGSKRKALGRPKPPPPAIELEF